MFTIRTETNWDSCQTEKPGLSGTENPDFTRQQSQKCQVGGTCYRPSGMTALQVDLFIESFGQQTKTAMNENPGTLIIVGDLNDSLR